MTPCNVLNQVRPFWYVPHRETRIAVRPVDEKKTMMVVFIRGLLMLSGIGAVLPPGPAGYGSETLFSYRYPLMGNAVIRPPDNSSTLRH